jgi:hypothetical protein
MSRMNLSVRSRAHRALCVCTVLPCMSLIAAAAADEQCVPTWDNTIGQPGMNPFDQVRALTVYNGDVIAGGFFTNAGGVSANYIARWDGSQWHPLGSGMDAGVRSLTVYNGDLIAGGQFTTAGGVTVNGVARWDGSQWHPLGAGLSGGCCPWALAVKEYQGDLYAGGPFWNAGGVADTMFIARWDGSQWHSLGPGTTTHGMRDMTVYNGELIVGGDFTTIVGVPANRIARWNGSNFQPLGTGVSMGGDHSYVETVTVYNGLLIAAGQFNTAGSQSASHIAGWNGSSWQTLGDGVSGGCCGSVWAVIQYDGDLIAAGPMTTADGTTVNGIARWDGTAWHPLSDDCPDTVENGCGFDVWPMAMTTIADELIVGGAFSTAFGLAANSIVAWNACPDSAIPGDLNGDGMVNVTDLLILFDNWGACDDCEDCPADLDGDCVVNVSDLLILFDNWT